MFHTAPHRHRTSKWYVSLDEYPYHLWPQYISAGAYALTKEALITMYYASYYTVHFRYTFNINVHLNCKFVRYKQFFITDLMIFT